jgi:hypothetical protein
VLTMLCKKQLVSCISFGVGFLDRFLPSGLPYPGDSGLSDEAIKTIDGRSMQSE